MKPAVLALVLLAAPAFAPPQAPATNTEIYLADFAAVLAARNPPDRPAAVPLVNISNSPGYDNQPSFTPDGAAVLFTSNRDGKQSDIYRYDIGAKALTQLTRTAESEYSPLVTPDGKTFSTVRVEADNTQRLWRFDPDGTNPRLVLEAVKPVGYHAWIDATHLALFVLGAARGEPATLQIADTSTGKSEVVASNIGRSIALRPGGASITYVNKAATPWTIWEVDLATRERRLAAALSSETNGAGVEDYAWDGSADRGQAVYAWGTRLIAWWPLSRGGTSWRVLGDVGAAGVTRITRLAISRDSKWLALVAEPVQK